MATSWSASAFLRLRSAASRRRWAAVDCLVRSHTASSRSSSRASMSAISLRRTASWADASPTNDRSSRTRSSRAERVVVVVGGFFAAQAACPEPIDMTTNATTGATGRCGISRILSNSSNSYNDPHRGSCCLHSLRALRVQEAAESDCGAHGPHGGADSDDEQPDGAGAPAGHVEGGEQVLRPADQVRQDHPQAIHPAEGQAGTDGPLDEPLAHERHPDEPVR